MNDNVTPTNGWLIVCECEHPFAKSNSPLDLDVMRGNSRLQWNRVVASGHPTIAKDDLVCVAGDNNTQNKLFMDGDVCFGSIHQSAVQFKIEAKHATGVKNKIRTADIEVAEMEEASKAAERFRAAQMLSPNSTARRMIN